MDSTIKNSIEAAKILNLRNKKTIRPVLVLGFPGVGKSYANLKNESITIDSDSSQFHWYYEDELGLRYCCKKIPEGFWSDKIKKCENPNFEEDYKMHLEKAMNNEKLSFIFASTHIITQNFAKNYKNRAYMIVPSIEAKEIYLERYKKRGNDAAFIELLSNNWDKWIDSAKKFCEENSITLIELTEETDYHIDTNVLNFMLEEKTSYIFSSENKANFKVYFYGRKKIEENTKEFIEKKPSKKKKVIKKVCSKEKTDEK